MIHIQNHHSNLILTVTITLLSLCSDLACDPSVRHRLWPCVGMSSAKLLLLVVVVAYFMFKHHIFFPVWEPLVYAVKIHSSPRRRTSDADKSILTKSSFLLVYKPCGAKTAQIHRLRPLQFLDVNMKPRP